MPFDPTLPATGSPMSSVEMRNQFTGLKALIDALDARVTVLEPPPNHGQATDPTPANGATNVQRGWDTYGGVPNQPAKIYWGDSPDTLAYLTSVMNSPASLLPALQLMQLEANTTYYWRVDLWNPMDDTTVTGDVWHFATGMM